MKKMFSWLMAILFATAAGMGAFDIARAENGLLVIENGTGSGEYSAGDLVPIEADTPEEGYTFHAWEGDVGGITDIYHPSTTVIVQSEKSDIYPVYVEEESRCKAKKGRLNKYQSVTINVDGHTGEEHTTRPRVDKNDGLNGDNPRFRRHNVARAFHQYWYTSGHQKSGEPNPKGEQWVDYKPVFSVLGVGWYRIIPTYRATKHRPSYPAYYYVKNTKTGRDILRLRLQNQSKGYRNFNMGVYYMCKDSYLRVEDKGSGSILFKEAKFIYLGPTLR